MILIKNNNINKTLSKIIKNIIDNNKAIKIYKTNNNIQATN